MCCVFLFLFDVDMSGGSSPDGCDHLFPHLVYESATLMRVTKLLHDGKIEGESGKMGFKGESREGAEKSGRGRRGARGRGNQGNNGGVGGQIAINGRGSIPSAVLHVHPIIELSINHFSECGLTRGLTMGTLIGERALRADRDLFEADGVITGPMGEGVGYRGSCRAHALYWQ